MDGTIEKKLTREYLFNLIVAHFNLLENYLLYSHNRDMLIRVFQNSARIAHILESEIEKREKYYREGIYSLLNEFVSIIEVDSFRVHISQNVRKTVDERMKKNGNMHIRAFIIVVFKEIAAFHNKMIDDSFRSPWFNVKEKTISNNAPQTFLSYSYDDKGISLGLYVFFLVNGGFLYVNWMWSGVNQNSSITKTQLENELNHSDQFLFLRTLNSELEYHGGSQIRQWCSWEIGNYYTKRKEEKYVVNFYGSDFKKNDMLFTFRTMASVINGRIVD